MTKTKHPKITTTKGVVLEPIDAPTDQLIPSWQKKTSKSLKEYQITVNGGTRRYGTNIIDIDNADPLKINKRLQVIITVKKKLNLDPSLKGVDLQNAFKEATLNLKIDSHDMYYLKFWSGNGPGGEGLFLEYEIPVN